MNFRLLVILPCMILFILPFSSMAQPITGVWKGNSGKQKIELKMIKSGDSLTGTAYYYTSADHYRRYSIKGYFDPRTNDAIWWDDVLIQDNSKKGAIAEKPAEALLNMADFNCPGEDDLRLDGNSYLRDETKKHSVPLNLQKKASRLFPDEWDWVIANYTQGANDPYIIDSIAKLSSQPFAEIRPQEANPVNTVRHTQEQALTKKTDYTPPKESPIRMNATTAEEKFSSRKKILEQIIPLKGDSVELRFYDNGEIDGDSIALFLNNKLVFKHVMITDRAYIVKFAVKDLEDDNEAVMVAENLGSIPPNTSLMIAVVDNKEYEAHLYADENSSALIRFIKETKSKSAVK